MEKRITVILNRSTIRVAIICFQIIDLIRHKNGYTTHPELLRRIKGTNENKARAIENLLSVEFIYREGTGTAGDRYYYGLTGELGAIWCNEQQKTRTINRYIPCKLQLKKLKS